MASILISGTLLKLLLSVVAESVAMVEPLATALLEGVDASRKDRFRGEVRRVFIIFVVGTIYHNIGVVVLR